MLTRLDLEHFKCFRLLKLPLGRLSLLAGANASGKSSVLQALVLLHQTMKANEWSTRLLLNGEALQLGTVTDVVDKMTGRRGFRLGLVDGNRSFTWTFEGEDRRDMSVSIVEVRIEGTVHDTPSALHWLLPGNALPEDEGLAGRMTRMSYLTAERVGPREVYPLGDPDVVQSVGPRGEFAASLLEWGRDKPVLKPLLAEGVVPTRFHQVAARMGRFFPGSSIDVQPIKHTNGITLGIRTSDETDFHRPVHVGFGLTQVLPIIVAALSACPEDLILIENPEVHLHPAGQAQMGHFLAEVAAAGIQIILETHSDHVLNGVRRAVKGRVIAPEEVCIHFFRDRAREGAQVVSPIIDGGGNLDAWPEGFFDQFDKDMNHFAGWGE